MALRNNPASTSAQFEEMDDNTVEAAAAAAPGVDTSAAAPAPDRAAAAAAAVAKSQAAAAATAPAVVAQKTTALSPIAAGMKKHTVIDELQNVIGADMLQSISIGAFPRIVAHPRLMNKETQKPLGDKARIDLVSWNYVTVVTPGAPQTDKEAAKLIRQSYDGVNIASGEGTVNEYLKELKGLGYDKASARQYVEMYANLVWTEKDGGVAPEDQKLCQISVPPTSVGRWDAFRLNQRIAQSKGIEIGNLVTLVGGSLSKDGNTWGTLDFTAKLT